MTIVKSVANRFWALALSDQNAQDAEESWEEVRNTGLPPTTWSAAQHMTNSRITEKKRPILNIILTDTALERRAPEQQKGKRSLPKSF